MAVRFRRKELPKRPSSKHSSSMVSPSSPPSPRSKPLAFSCIRAHIGRSWPLPCVVLALFVVFFVYVTWKLSSSQGPISRFYSFDIVNEFPHDPQAFTQGLLYDRNGTLLESTGIYGRVGKLYMSCDFQFNTCTSKCNCNA